jgi:hypothetical protein
MRKVPTPSGPFPFQLYFEDPGEIDEICLEASEDAIPLALQTRADKNRAFCREAIQNCMIYEDLGPE